MLQYCKWLPLKKRRIKKKTIKLLLDEETIAEFEEMNWRKRIKEGRRDEKRSVKKIITGN